MANYTNDQYGVSASGTLTETGTPLFPGVPQSLQLGSGGNDIISQLDIPLDPTVLNPHYRFVSIQYWDFAVAETHAARVGVSCK